MRKLTSTKQPDTNEIKEVGVQISKAEFWSCISFSDTTSRYVETTMKIDNVSRLHGIAMYCLVIMGGSSTPTQLAKMMFRSKHSMTKIIDSLEAEGLVTRDYTDKDRRVTYIKLTNDGLEYVKQNISEKANKRAQEAIACLDKSEQKILVTLMEKMRKNMTLIMNEL
jgi:DNA-binding MarR family transcriptional regulator